MDVPLNFLYSDAAIVVVDKPAGLPVIPMPGQPVGACLRDRVAAAIGTRAWVVHRLDRETSGVVAFARCEAAHRTLSMAFEARLVEKHYLAFVAGRPAASTGVIDVALVDARRGKTRPAAPGDAGARASSSSYGVERVWQVAGGRVAALDVSPATGRRHQIRVHLRSIGTPILGDALYGRGATGVDVTRLPVPRLALHAATLAVPHPTSGERLAVTAPWPPDLVALATWLDEHGTREGAS